MNSSPLPKLPSHGGAAAGLALCCLLWAGAAAACNVPVFRYALERWPADACRVTVFHRETLSTEQRALVEALFAAEANRQANLAVSVVDTTKQTAGEGATPAIPFIPATLPALVVQHPAGHDLEQAAWKGSLNATSVALLLDSPARREVRRRILHGDSLVWLLVESGDRARDDAAAERLSAESRRLSETLEIPPVDPEDPRTGDNVSLKIAISLLRLSAADPAEAVLVSSLKSLEQRFAGDAGPLAFPVFGRGRALSGMTEDELTPAKIEKVATFVTGACSCEVKRMNPGVDLLIAGDWDAQIKSRTVRDPERPPLVSLSQWAAPVPPGAPTGASPPAAPPPAAPARSGALTRNVIAAIIAGIAAVAAVAVGLRSGRRTT